MQFSEYKITDRDRDNINFLNYIESFFVAFSETKSDYIHGVNGQLLQAPGAEYDARAWGAWHSSPGHDPSPHGGQERYVNDFDTKQHLKDYYL